MYTEKKWIYDLKLPKDVIKSILKIILFFMNNKRRHFFLKTTKQKNVFEQIFWNITQSKIEIYTIKKKKNWNVFIIGYVD